MVTLSQKAAAEQEARAMLDDHGLPQPDDVEYGVACIRLLWREERVCLVVDIEAETPTDDWAPGEDSAPLEGLETLDLPGY